ncbi:WecB/TagA/CpsF family glycosyltransferase [Arthrobacter nitrophenolicus]|uniref:WecB/TagA/CpsF family glycosyltransferase n=1 Tax=Arthrobacter nitrophenolicus TaxID=683150 RepID=UPI003899E771
MNYEKQPPEEIVQPSPPLFSTAQLGGLPVAVSNLENAAKKLCWIASNGSRNKGLAIHLVNAYTIALADQDKDYAAVFKDSSANLPDGKPLVCAGNMKGHALRQVRGPSLFREVAKVGRSTDIKHFLLGATDETLRLLKAELQDQYPGISIVGEISPPFREMTHEEILAQDQEILKSGAQIVWVGLGTPKQDFEVQRIAASLPVMAVAIGAAFDFIAGTKREAPEWMAKIGVEWLFRFASEPRRLWRRYLFGNIRFLQAIMKKN